MTEAEADEILRTKINTAAKVRLAEAVLEACAASSEEREIDARLRAKAGRVRGARVAVVIAS